MTRQNKAAIITQNKHRVHTIRRNKTAIIIIIFCNKSYECAYRDTKQKRNKYLYMSVYSNYSDYSTCRSLLAIYMSIKYRVNKYCAGRGKSMLDKRHQVLLSSSF